MSDRRHKRREVTCFLCSRVFRSFGELMEHKDRVHANGPSYTCPLCRFNGPTRNVVWDKHVLREHAAQIGKYGLKREDVTTASQRPSVTGSSARSRPVVSNKRRRSSSVESRETEGSIGPDPDFSISAPDNTEAYDPENPSINHGSGGQTPEKDEVEEHDTEETSPNETATETGSQGNLSMVNSTVQTSPTIRRKELSSSTQTTETMEQPRNLLRRPVPRGSIFSHSHVKRKTTRPDGTVEESDEITWTGPPQRKKYPCCD